MQVLRANQNYSWKQKYVDESAWFREISVAGIFSAFCKMSFISLYQEPNLVDTGKDKI